MAEYIGRETLMKFPIRSDHCDKDHANEHFINGIETVMEYAENLPAADVEPVRHGRWITTHDEFCSCSLCKYPVHAAWSRTNYCPNCGAKMDSKEEDGGKEDA